MKFIAFYAALLITFLTTPIGSTLSPVGGEGGESPIQNCKCKEINLYGKVRIVNTGETFKVRISDFPDLNVLITPHPLKCGEWEFVEIGENFSIRFVEIGEDFSIKYSNFPGTTK